MSTTFRADAAWLPTGPAGPTEIDVDDRGLITAVRPASAGAGTERLPGLVMPGFANAHSHAFHRGLRGRAHGGTGTFWTWRETMYALAGRLDPGRLRELARAAFAEMLVAGYTSVGEFHYLHHRPDGGRWDDPFAPADALRGAAADVGIRLTLLDTCYLTAGIDPDGRGRALQGPQRGFSDSSAAAWARRWRQTRDRYPDGDGFSLGAALHSCRAVPADAFGTVLEAIGPDTPLHIHVSEQPAENREVRAAYGRTPVGLLDAHGVLSARTSAVHSTHLTDDDVARLAASGATAVLCPTTEADLADGVGPVPALTDAGVPLAIGSDQHVVVDPWLELQALEAGQRLMSGSRTDAGGRRVQLAPATLIEIGTAAGHRSLGRPGTGRIEVGAPFDVLAVRTDSARTAGALPAQLVMAATAADVTDVVVGGRRLVSGGAHRDLGEPGPLLAAAIDTAWEVA